jgi:glyoxylase-like metal-dependent hydrolase (beta-lactamase superfamily II)
MIFTLEVLNAKWGDCLLLHVGDPESLDRVLIDGGPAGVYRSVLRPRLDELAARRTEGGPLPIRLAMVSHLDADHITGLLDMARDLDQRREDREELPYEIDGLWLNSLRRRDRLRGGCGPGGRGAGGTAPVGQRDGLGRLAVGRRQRAPGSGAA